MKKTLIIGIVAASLVLGMVAYATAATGTATVTATVNPKLEMSIDDSTLAFGSLDPEVNGSGNAVLTVRSNKAFTVSRAIDTGDDLATLIGLTIDNGATGSFSKNASNAGQVLTDKYSYLVPWSTTPGTYSQSFTYTVTQ